jgi:hypothetical protein
MSELVLGQSTGWQHVLRYILSVPVESIAQLMFNAVFSLSGNWHYYFLHPGLKGTVSCDLESRADLPSYSNNVEEQSKKEVYLVKDFIVIAQ